MIQLCQSEVSFQRVKCPHCRRYHPGVRCIQCAQQSLATVVGTLWSPGKAPEAAHMPLKNCTVRPLFARKLGAVSEDSNGVQALGAAS